jgi:hypothetical protein
MVAVNIQNIQNVAYFRQGYGYSKKTRILAVEDFEVKFLVPCMVAIRITFPLPKPVADTFGNTYVRPLSNLLRCVWASLRPLT